MLPKVNDYNTPYPMIIIMKMFACVFDIIK